MSAYLILFPVKAGTDEPGGEDHLDGEQPYETEESHRRDLTLLRAQLKGERAPFVSRLVYAPD